MFYRADNVIRVNVHGEWKLCDYGFSKITESMGEASKRDMTKVGTPYYMSPEILNGKKYGYRTDIYSVGIILYQLLYGRMPFIAKSMT